ncbi:hypothetical protein FS837_010617 [Tulasnella sp. UAMH 9824]|nr:hypothetical protein FS837_010617 [Tulasnella sp. UAMH 9824]
MSRYRIDARQVKPIDGGPNAKGGQGTVVVGTIMPPEEVCTWAPGPDMKELCDKTYAILEFIRDSEEINKGVTSSKSAAESLIAAFMADRPDLENFPNWMRDKLVEEQLETKYAIKKLEWYHNDVEESVKFFKSFVNELSLMAELSHPNIIQLIGFVEDMEKYDAWIVLPWEVNGNVREFLQSGEWDIPERISLIQDVVKGVEYLHTREPPICHGDLKSLNILVNQSNRAVITDFGSARKIPNANAKDDTASEELQQAVNDDTAQELTTPKIEFNRSTLELTLTGPLGTLRWAAPEVLADEGKGLPSDMWAVGWICWEIMTGKIPFEELPHDANVVARVMTGKLPAIRDEAQLLLVLKLCALMSDCWKRYPAERIGSPDFQRRVDMMVSRLTQDCTLDDNSAVQKPSIAPSDCAAGGSKIRSAELLLQLGEIYQLQDNYAMAKAHIESALNVASQTSNHSARAHGLDTLGGIHCGQSRYQEAEKAFREAHEIHARIGDDLGAANALNALGYIYRAQSRNQEAAKAFGEAHVIQARIGHDLGAANGLLLIQLWVHLEPVLIPLYAVCFLAFAYVMSHFMYSAFCPLHSFPTTFA